MTVSQKRAIGYAVRRKQHESMYQFLVDYALNNEFENGKLKTKQAFLRKFKDNIYKKLAENDFKNCDDLKVIYINCTRAMNGKYKANDCKKTLTELYSE